MTTAVPGAGWAGTSRAAPDASRTGTSTVNPPPDWASRGRIVPTPAVMPASGRETCSRIRAAKRPEKNAPATPSSTKATSVAGSQPKVRADSARNQEPSRLA